MRPAIAKGTAMIGLKDRIHSIESVEDLQKKFAQAGVAVAEFTPPDAQFDGLELLAFCRKSKMATIRTKLAAER